MTAKWSDVGVAALKGRPGLEMWVIGLCPGATRVVGDLKDSQYDCSDVNGAGPVGSFTGCSGSTGAAICALDSFKGVGYIASDVVEDELTSMLVKWTFFKEGRSAEKPKTMPRASGF